MSKDEEMINTIELTDDEGNTVEFEILLEFDYNDRFYIALYPLEPIDGVEDGEVVIYRVEQDGENEIFTGCETEEELEGAYNVFMEEYEFADDEGEQV